MPETATGGVLWKKEFLKISQNLQETPALEETLMNFANSLGTPFLTEQLQTSASEMETLQKRSEGDCLCCREVDTMLIASMRV